MQSKETAPTISGEGKAAVTIEIREKETVTTLKARLSEGQVIQLEQMWDALTDQS